MSIAIASIIVLVVVGALGGLLLFRVVGRAAARNENQPEGGDAEAGNPEEGLREETRRSVWHFVGVGAAGGAILVSLAAIGTAFSRAQEFQNDAAPVGFIALILAVVAYFLGARMLAVVAVVFTVVALVIAAIISQYL